MRWKLLKHAVLPPEENNERFVIFGMVTKGTSGYVISDLLNS
jgi:hypothetical protein